MEQVSMFLFRRKKLHEQQAQELKKDIKRELNEATQTVKANRKTLQANGITLEIKKAIGGHHV